MTARQKLLDTGARIARRAADDPPRLRRFLRLDEVERLTGLKHAAIYEKASRNEFPRPVKLSDNPKAKKHSVRWIEDEVIAWQETHIAKRDIAPLPKPYKRKTRKLCEPASI
jgi:predicted DNA-binding transcriptional regulator AlpA